MNASVRFGVLGLGMGYNRAKLVAMTKGAELKCVCDLLEDKAKKTAEELNCDWTTRYDDLLSRDDIDVIGIFTPSGTHCDNAVKALKAGKHVFVTKPMDIRLEKCDEAIRAAEEVDQIFAVDFESRYLEVNQKIKMAIDGGRLGRLLLGDLRMKWYRSQEYYDSGNPPGWRSRKVTEGGSAANQGVHYIDLLQWWVGPVRTVYGRSGTLAHKIETEDLSMALLTFQNGAWGTIITTTAAYPQMVTTIEMHGEKGSIIWKEPKVKLFQCKDELAPSLDDYKIDSERPKNIIEDMVSAVKQGTPVAVDGYEGRKTVAIVNAIYESSVTGKVIELTY